MGVMPSLTKSEGCHETLSVRCLAYSPANNEGSIMVSHFYNELTLSYIWLWNRDHQGSLESLQKPSWKGSWEELTTGAYHSWKILFLLHIHCWQFSRIQRAGGMSGAIARLCLVWILCCLLYFCTLCRRGTDYPLSWTISLRMFV